MSKAKKHHYAPVAYLRGFCKEYPRNLGYKRNRLSTWVCDIHGNLPPQLKGVDNVLYENYLYSCIASDGNKFDSVERCFSKLEADIKDVAKQLLDIFAKQEAGRTPIRKKIKEILSVFVHIQYVRTPKFRKNEIEKMLKDEIQALSSDNLTNMTNWLMLKAGNDLKTTCNCQYASFAEMFCNKNFAFFFIKGNNKKFITSDAPVYLLVNDGLIHENTEICFPVNEKIFLVMKGTGNSLDVKYLSSKSDMDFIRKINEKTAEMAYRYIVGSDELLLKSLAKFIRDNQCKLVA